MRFSTFIFRNVLRRRIRSTLTMTGMAVAVSAVVALVGLADGFRQSMLKLYTDRGVSLIVTQAGAVSPLSTILPEKVAQDISKLDGVEATCAGLVDFQMFEEFGSDPVGLQGWPLGNYMFSELKIVGGENLSEKHLGNKCCVVGNNLANTKSVKIGQSITVAEQKFTVVGIFESSQDIESNMVVMLLEDCQKVLGKKGSITGCTVNVKDKTPEGVAAMRELIETKVAENNKCKLRAKPPGEFVQQSNQIRAASAMAWMTSAVALFIGGIGVLNTMFMSVFERTREIGILRAIGWCPSRVMKMILLESVLLSIGGGVIGTAGGLLLIKVLSRLPVVNGVVQAAITPDIVMKGFAIAIVVGLVGAAYPAYRGSQLLPTEALRHE